MDSSDFLKVKNKEKNVMITFMDLDKDSSMTTGLYGV